MKLISSIRDYLNTKDNVYVRLLPLNGLMLEIIHKTYEEDSWRFYRITVASTLTSKHSGLDIVKNSIAHRYPPDRNIKVVVLKERNVFVRTIDFLLGRKIPKIPTLKEVYELLEIRR
jgi:hypothetical protein